MIKIREISGPNNQVGYGGGRKFRKLDERKVNLKMKRPRQTVFHEKHVALGAKMVEFGGWEMPLSYPTGILGEHLATRKRVGLFDVSHMGRFTFKGPGALKFLNHFLSNNVEALDPRVRGAQYTLIPDQKGGTIDDAYLYRFVTDEFLLVVNAANIEKDWSYFKKSLESFSEVTLADSTDEIAMLSLQGPQSRQILKDVIEGSRLPEPYRNAVCSGKIGGAQVMVARTGYTGEPLGFEIFTNRDFGLRIWDELVARGATPAGLGARDTLRLEAGLPLYGHELGKDPEGKEMPMLAYPLARTGVSFSVLKGNYNGRESLLRQFEALCKIMDGDYSMLDILPRIIRPLDVTGRGVAREGARVFKGNRHVGYVTSGTMVPMWEVKGEGLESFQADRKELRSLCLACIDSNIREGEKLEIEIRAKRVEAVVVAYHLRSEAPPYARPIVYGYEKPPIGEDSGDIQARVTSILKKTVENTRWRQQECINLIPSEMTASPMSRLVSIMDPCFRYAEHRNMKAFYDTEIYYYQGTDFIREVEEAVNQEMRKFLRCAQVETRPISGQMANMAAFSAMMDYINRLNPKAEPRRIRMVMNNHIQKGGHLSAQPMGALKDFVAWDPRTERPAVVAFPVLAENPYKIDVTASFALIEEYRPELIVLGKSMVLHKEPVAEIRKFLDSQGLRCVLMYDAAHVLGLIGPYFQQPFEEGADLVTGSTHKTFFGTQRGIIGSRFKEKEEGYELWESVKRRVFPGSVSNHHLGTLLGLLIAAYEMNYFKDEYQRKVIANAKAFAKELKACGLDVAGDPDIDYTETHQVVLRVGYGRGAQMARRLEENNIICNYQAGPDEEGFTAAGFLRMGVSEMTRFGMEEEDFGEVASLIHEVVSKGKKVGGEVKSFRKRFSELKFCFKAEEYAELLETLHHMI